MTIARTIFAIFASVLLVGAQIVSAVVGKEAPPQSKVCSCCACKKINCCVAQPASAPEQVPAIPANAGLQNHFQIVAIVAALILQSNDTPTQKISVPLSVSFKVTSVPLYEWNCSYLV